jgi:hypothetical protein
MAWKKWVVVSRNLGESGVNEEARGGGFERVGGNI